MKQPSLRLSVLCLAFGVGCSARTSIPSSQAKEAAADAFAQEYSITSTIEVLKPISLDALNNDFQEGRVVAETAKTVTLEIRTYPLRTQKSSITANANWRQEYSNNPDLQRYLKPGITTNWDEGMSQELIAALAADGVQVGPLTDKALVEVVSRWLFGGPPFNKFPFKDFFVSYHLSFASGMASVIPQLRGSFDATKKSFQINSDEEAFAYGAYGKGMFKTRTHGNCTASATLAATVFKALGIPTRLVLFVPPIDGADPAQVAMLQSAIHHSGILPTIMEGIATVTQGWASHTFNEVYVGNQWVRLNYTNLGQDPLDADYLGLMLQVVRVADWAESGLPESWGVHAMAQNVVPLSSSNPYRGLAVTDHVGSLVQLPDPPKPFTEIRIAKISAAYTKSSPGLSDAIRNRINDSFLLKADPSVPHAENWKYLRLFAVHNNRFILRAAGHAGVAARSSGTITDAGFEGWRLYITDPINKMKPGVAYHPVPLSNEGDYRWEIPESLTISVP